MRRALVLLLIACGGKLDGDGMLDAASDVVANPDAPHSKPLDSGLFPDAPFVVDAGMMGCTPAMVQVGMGGNGCKANATWTCNGDTYSVGGGCNTQTGMLSGSCMKNNMPTTSFSDVKCQCTDPKLIAAQYAKDCGFPPPP
jgi:hypothetical protein